MVAMGPLEPYCSGSHPSPKMQAQTEYACEECLVQLPPPPPPKGHSLGQWTSQDGDLEVIADAPAWGWFPSGSWPGRR